MIIDSSVGLFFQLRERHLARRIDIELWMISGRASWNSNTTRKTFLKHPRNDAAPS